ncbi:MAG: GH3 auxin-responsive promoter family protein [Bacteroidales bacterium]|nr:GH3 auxin-responsive promoter family protein [Bacteroidales bacterium]
MAVIGSILKEVVKIKKSSVDKKELSFLQQEKILRKLLEKAKHTSFGKKFEFERILSSDNLVRNFQSAIPVYDYEKIYAEWWHLLQKGEGNVTWPGKVRFFGLTSGTSNDSSKRVPLTKDMIKAMRKVGIRQLLALTEFDLPPDFYEKSVLMLGGSTNLIKIEDYFEGDLSGILAGRLPFWFNKFYKPGKISKERDWSTKLERIVDEAIKWDIVGIAGVPAWVQILLEKIIDRYEAANIHNIWPNFRVYAHGGVHFAPYKKSFQKLLGKPVHLLETYLASEGFLAYQKKENSNMQLVIDNGIFFEFIPFDTENFTPEGQLVKNPRVLLLNEIEENKEYAALLSTVAGAWRYLIGDTIKFTSARDYEIIITGRTKHFLSLCGEHLSVDNMTNAIDMISGELNIDIKEFTVAGIPYRGLFAHKWYIGTSAVEIDPLLVRKKLDTALKKLNDDYATERKAALKEIFVEILPEKVFYDWLRSKGKEGGQHKFPRVLGGNYSDWKGFAENYRKDRLN